MFDLETHVRAWREQMEASLGSNDEVIDELESHLREEFERQTGTGKPPEHAWSAATARLGDAGAIASEFRRAAGTFWLPTWVAGCVLVATAVCVAGFVVMRLGNGRFTPLLAAHVFAVTIGYVTTFAVGGMAVWAVLSADGRLGSFRSAAGRFTLVGLALTAVGVVLGAVWAKEHLGRYWGWDARETGAVFVVAAGLAMLCFALRPAGGSMALFLGLIGNIVVSLAWFAPPLMESTRAGGQTAAGYGLAAFVATQLILLALAYRRTLRTPSFQ
jgi:hypothetical protein